MLRKYAAVSRNIALLPVLVAFFVTDTASAMAIHPDGKRDMVGTLYHCNHTSTIRWDMRMLPPHWALLRIVT